MTMHPCVVPDRGVSDRTMNVAFATLNELIALEHPVPKKPWWKFW